MILNAFGTAGIASLTKILDYKKEQLAKAAADKNDARRIQLEGEVARIKGQIDILSIQKELGLADRKSFFFRVWLYTLVASVMLYWSARFWVRLLGVDADYGILVSDLNAAEIAISTIVVGYVFAQAKLG